MSLLPPGVTGVPPPPGGDRCPSSPRGWPVSLLPPGVTGVPPPPRVAGSCVSASFPPSSQRPRYTRAPGTASPRASSTCSASMAAPSMRTIRCRMRDLDLAAGAGASRWFLWSRPPPPEASITKSDAFNLPITLRWLLKIMLVVYFECGLFVSFCSPRYAIDLLYMSWNYSGIISFRAIWPRPAWLEPCLRENPQFYCPVVGCSHGSSICALIWRFVLFAAELTRHCLAYNWSVSGNVLSNKL